VLKYKYISFQIVAGQFTVRVPSTELYAELANCSLELDATAVNFAVKYRLAFVDMFVGRVVETRGVLGNGAGGIDIYIYESVVYAFNFRLVS